MFARGVLSLHTACPELGRRAPLSVPKTPTSKSRVSITSKLIETKRLQVLHSGHLRKTGGWGCYQFCQRLFRSPSFPRSFPPISTLASLFFNHLRTLSFSVSHLYPIPPAPSALFSKKRGVYPSGHTNAPDDPRLPLRNLFSALRLSELCVSAVSPSSPFPRLSAVASAKADHFTHPPTNHFRGHTNVTAAGARSVLHRYFSLRGAAARIAASNGWAWSKGREMRKRSARRAWAYFS